MGACWRRAEPSIRRRWRSAWTLRDDALALMRNENRTGLSKVDREEERTKSSTFIQPKCPKLRRGRGHN
jgi:hypothetical protein